MACMATPGTSDHVKGWGQAPKHQGMVQVEEHKDGNGLHQLPAPRAHPTPVQGTYPPSYLKGKPWIAGTTTRRCTEFWAPEAYDIPEGDTPESDSGDSTCTGSSSDSPSPRKIDGRRGKRRHSM